MNREDTGNALPAEDVSDPASKRINRLRNIFLLSSLTIILVLCCLYLLYVAVVQLALQPQIYATLTAISNQATIPTATVIPTLIPSATP